MLYRNMLKSKKAISPILATLLLIVIAVAAIVVTYAWVMTYMGSTTQQAGFIPYKANVAFGSGSITIDIGNSGTSSGKMAAIYIGNSSSALQTQSAVSPALSASSIGAGDIVSFSVTYTWATGTTYYFKVVPTSGAALEFPATAPSA
jgi:flagellin-like protein